MATTVVDVAQVILSASIGSVSITSIVLIYTMDQIRDRRKTESVRWFVRFARLLLVAIVLGGFAALGSLAVVLRDAGLGLTATGSTLEANLVGLSILLFVGALAAIEGGIIYLAYQELW